MPARVVSECGAALITGGHLTATACSAGDKGFSASTSGDWLYLFLKIALAIELLEVCPQILSCLLVFDPGKYHFGARDFCFRILDVFLESLFVHTIPEFLLASE